MKTFNATVQIVKLYTVSVEAKDLTTAIQKATRMQSTAVAERGSLQSVETEVLDVNEG